MKYWPMLQNPVVSFELNQIETSIENYKSEFSVYPLDMGNPALLQAHVNKISRSHRHGTVFNPNPTEVLF